MPLKIKIIQANELDPVAVTPVEKLAQGRLLDGECRAVMAMDRTRSCRGG